MSNNLMLTHTHTLVGKLVVGNLHVGSFDQLREKLTELKQRADGVKYVIRIDKNELKMLKN
jgi:hypothetical protein